MRTAQNTKRSKSKSPDKVRKNQTLIVRAHQDYLDVSSDYLNKARQTLALLEKPGLTGALDLARKAQIEDFMISKGKAGVAAGLGVKVCILEDQHQFILATTK